MADRLSKKQRSWNMSRIKGIDTQPEIRVRKYLHKKGLRFRLHRKDLPGRPDIVLPKYRTCIFVHGCFWHRHKGCKFSYIPKSRIDFWERKFRENVARDKQIKRFLTKAGWKVITIWECQIEKVSRLDKCYNEVLKNVTDINT